MQKKFKFSFVKVFLFLVCSFQEQLASSQCVESGPANQQPLEQDHQHGGVFPSHVLCHAQQRPCRQGHHSQVGLLKKNREMSIVVEP